MLTTTERLVSAMTHFVPSAHCRAVWCHCVLHTGPSRWHYKPVQKSLTASLQEVGSVYPPLESGGLGTISPYRGEMARSDTLQLWELVIN